MPMISVIVPAYNEERSIGKVLDDIKRNMRQAGVRHEIIVVDDGSGDRTPSIAKGRKVRVVSHPYNMGYGASLKTGMRKAAGDWILIMDADGTYPPESIKSFLKYMPDFDMVVGARTGEKVNVQLYRKPTKWALTKLATYLSGKKIPDLNSGMRLFRKSDMMRFMNILPSGFSFTTTSTLAYLCNDLTIKYLPINYDKREGKSKIRPIRDGANFFLLIFRAITYFNPLKIFMPVAGTLFVLGLISLFYELIMLQDLAQAPVLLILASLQTGFLGLLADVMTKKN